MQDYHCPSDTPHNVESAAYRTKRLLKKHKPRLSIRTKSLPLHTDYVQLINQTVSGPSFWPSGALMQSKSNYLLIKHLTWIL